MSSLRNSSPPAIFQARRHLLALAGRLVGEPGGEPILECLTPDMALRLTPLIGLETLEARVRKGVLLLLVALAKQGWPGLPELVSAGVSYPIGTSPKIWQEWWGMVVQTLEQSGVEIGDDGVARFPE